MELKETGRLLQEIDRFYPGKLKLEPATVEAWYRVMKKQDYKKVIRRLDQFVVSSQYPPMIYDLYDRPRPEHNKDVLSQIAEWEAKADGGPVQS
ncbi:replicative helicase loader/inhibitor [Alteribacter populi]|uniref:replicative helicase loader/inhibitor n=1 Tax=Alteribacter populi TaxID=2011011 RepID=UPI000BBA7A92|nr:replicative helicase loader/inhibitor [Alteribacter populi]